MKTWKLVGSKWAVFGGFFGCLVLFTGTGCNLDVILIEDYPGAGEKSLSGAYCDPRSEYLVVWENGGSYPYNRVYGTTISADGVLGVTTEIVNTGLTDFRTRTLYDVDAGQYLVAFSASDGVTGVFVSQDVQPGTPFLIGDGILADMVYNPVAGEYLVAMNPESGGVAMGQRLSLTGERLGAPFPLSQEGNRDRVDKLVFNSDRNEYLTIDVDDEYKGPGGNELEIYARIYDVEGSPQGDWIPIAEAPVQEGYWYFTVVMDPIQAAYVPEAQHYVMYAHISFPVSPEAPWAGTFGRTMSPSGDLSPAIWIANMDLPGQNGPLLIHCPANGKRYLVYSIANAVLCTQGLNAAGKPEEGIRPYGFTYLTELDNLPSMTVQLQVVPSSTQTRALALWTRFTTIPWGSAAYGMIVDLENDGRKPSGILHCPRATPAQRPESILPF